MRVLLLERYYLLNLQLFAGGEGNKTEKATPKKRQEARNKGQVLQSREITAAAVLVAVFIGLRLFGGLIYNELFNFTKKIYTEYTKIEDFASIDVLSKLFVEILTTCFKTIGPILAIAVGAGLLLSYAQVGFLFTVETLGLKFDRINPINGFKRLFSVKSVVELIKAVLKVSVVGFIVYLYIKDQASIIFSMMDMNVLDIAINIGIICMNVSIRMCVVLIFLGVLDYIYQWWDYEKSLKMSKHDIKEEFKQTEGNPEIKSKIKQKQRQMSLRRMMQEIPQADVVITNPTHFAVAIKYDQKVADAPVVLAKGQDFIAFRIKEIAKEHNVKIVENKLLARTLYNTVEIGQKIPEELYQAVAEILAFVYQLRGEKLDVRGENKAL